MPMKMLALVLVGILGMPVATQEQSPVITGITPAAPARSTKPQTLTIQGKNLLDGLTLAVTNPSGQTSTFQGGDIQSRRDTSFQITMLVDEAGAYSFVVTNRNGGMS